MNDINIRIFAVFLSCEINEVFRIIEETKKGRVLRRWCYGRSSIVVQSNNGQIY